MMAMLDDRLAALATLSAAELRAAWRQTTHQPAPEVSIKLLRLALAHRLQERKLGALSPRHARMLGQLERQYLRKGDLGVDEAAHLKTGSRLVRVWQGETHQVQICDDGYRYRDQHYRSLSEIARTITGAHWSGPRFFGLTSCKVPRG